MERLFAIDPSLTCSGWAVFNIKRGELIAVGKIRSLPPKFPLAARLDDLQDKVRVFLRRAVPCANDILVCEAHTSVKDPSAAIKVEQVRSIFEAVGRECGIVVPGRVNPRSVQQHVLGLSGRQLPRKEVKASAASVVASIFADSLQRIAFPTDLRSLTGNQDIVDAILVGYYALGKIRQIYTNGGSSDDLLAEFAPNGVGYRRAWERAFVSRAFKE